MTTEPKLQDEERQYQERERRRYRAKAWRAILCFLACFWIAVAFIGYSVWPETVMGANR